MSSTERKALLRNDSTAWPTLLLTLGAVGGFIASTALAVSGLFPWSAAIVVNVVCAFATFTPMHDASHKSVSRTRWVNELVGRVAAVPLVAPFTAFRHLHLEHHKHTNEPEHDPDFWSGRGPKWMLPLRWLTQDLHYYVLYFSHLGSRPRAERRETVITFALLYAAATGFALTGYLVPVLLLWLVPARIATALLAFSFDYLPHRPHDTPAKVDRHRATRLFVDPWLTPLFLFQNFHLVHHLFPGVPFYRYRRVWYALEDELRAKGATPELLVGSLERSGGPSRVTTPEPRSVRARC
jgi:fatty acid desaturase